MSWLKKFLGICNHRWTIISTTMVVDKDRFPIALIHTLQCDHCGNIKTEKVRN